MALRYPGAPPQVRSSLLGTYQPSAYASAQSRMQTRKAGAGLGGLDISDYEMPDMTKLSSKYLSTMPAVDIETDPSKIYEASMGGYRSDVQQAMTEAGRQAISQAAASGREVADVMARYLPEAVRGYGAGAATVAGRAAELGAEAGVAKSELELRRTGMAQEMARFEQSQAQQQQQFVTQLKTQYQMHREQLANNYRVAMSQAASARERQAVQNAHETQMARLQQDFQRQAQEFAAAQENMRYTQNLQLQDKWLGSQAAAATRSDVLRGAGLVSQYPQYTPATTTGGVGTATYGGTQYRYNPNTGRFEEQ